MQCNDFIFQKLPIGQLVFNYLRYQCKKEFYKNINVFKYNLVWFDDYEALCKIATQQTL